MKRFRGPSLAVLVVGAGGIALVIGGIALARTMNLAACPLCILQRMGYLLLGVEALLILGARQPALLRPGAALMALTAAAGAGIAGYQTWLQRFAKGVNCTADQPWWERFVDWAGQQVPLLFEATGLCSEAGWRMLGLSIAEWSLLIFSGMTATLLAAALRKPA